MVRLNLIELIQLNPVGEEKPVKEEMKRTHKMILRSRKNTSQGIENNRMELTRIHSKKPNETARSNSSKQRSECCEPQFTNKTPNKSVRPNRDRSEQKSSCCEPQYSSTIIAPNSDCSEKWNKTSNFFKITSTPESAVPVFKFSSPFSTVLNNNTESKTCVPEPMKMSRTAKFVTGVFKTLENKETEPVSPVSVKKYPATVSEITKKKEIETVPLVPAKEYPKQLSENISQKDIDRIPLVPVTKSPNSSYKNACSDNKNPSRSIIINNNNNNNNNNTCSNIYQSPVNDAKYHVSQSSENSFYLKPLIVDVTNEESRQGSKRKRSSAIDITDDRSNFSDVPGNKMNNKKLKSDTSVAALTSQQKNKDIDVCSVISITSDEEDIINNEDTPKLNCTKEEEIVLLETPPPKKQKTTSQILVIDLSTPSEPVKRKTKVEKKKARKTRKEKNKAKKKPQKKKRREVKPWENVTLLNKFFYNMFTAPTSSHISCSGSKHQNQTVDENMSSRDLTAQQVNLTDVPASSVYGSNVYNPNPTKRTGLRPIVIDGSNVAMGHANGAYFSSRGLKICIYYFLKRSHKVIAFLPKFRRASHLTHDRHILDELERHGLISYTPSRKVNGKLCVSYDDRYVVQYAAECGGVVVSTDNYRDLLFENRTWKDTIENRLLMFTWAGDILMFPQDPLGRYGPNLDEFLRFP